MKHFMTMLALLAGSAQAQQPIPNPDNLPVVHWQGAAQYYGREAVVYGKVVMARDIGFMTFLNFHREYRKHFTVVIRRENYGAFPKPPERLYYNKKIAVRGKVIEYEDKPEIIVTSPDQITVLADDVDIPERVPVPTTQPPQVGGSVPVGSGRVTIANVHLDSALSREACAGGDAPPENPKVTRAVELIRELSADIVALQGTAGRTCLERFNEAHLKDLNYRHVFRQDGDGEAGLLSRYPALHVDAHMTFASTRGEREKFTFPPLEVEIELPSRERIAILVLQVPTREDGVNGSQRLAEMRGFRRQLDDLFASRPDAAVVVCGGFGESLDGKLVSVLAGSGRHELKVPGYVAPTDGEAEKPLLAQLTDFMLVSTLLEGRYLPGSTRIVQKKGGRPGVSADFGTAAAERVGQTPVRSAPRRDF